MKLKMKRPISLLLILCMVIVAFSGCSSKKQTAATYEDWLINTYCTITVYNPDKNAKAAADGAFLYARSLENILSKTIPGSDIYRYNASEAGEFVTEDTKYLAELSMGFYEDTKGLFDISVGAVQNLWDFAADSPIVPKEEEIQEQLLHTQKTDQIRIVPADQVNMQNPEGLPWFISKPDPQMQIDLGAIAKGYIAEKTCEYLQDHGISTALVNFGGNISLVGSKADGSDWVIAIEKPLTAADSKDIPLDQRQRAGIVKVKGGSIVTSGTYERCFYAEDGTLYHHILDPRMGYSIDTDIVSVSITGPSSTICDALSTSSLLLGCEDALKLIESMDGYECIIIDKDGQTTVSSGAGFTESK